MRRRLTAGLFVAGLALSASIFGLPASPALAGTLDQSQTSGSGGVAGVGFGADQTFGTGTFHRGQTFTAALSGSLDQADLYLERGCASVDALSVQIRTVSGDPPLPTTTVLATASVPAASVATFPSLGWVTVQFPTPATVSAGTPYALVAASGSTCSLGFGQTIPGYFWGLSYQNLYGAGTHVVNINSGANWFSQGGEDFGFKTYVRPAPPDSSGTGTGTGAGTTTMATGQRAAALKKCKKKRAAARRNCKKRAKRLPV